MERVGSGAWSGGRAGRRVSDREMTSPRRAKWSPRESSNRRGRARGIADARAGDAPTADVLARRAAGRSAPARSVEIPTEAMEAKRGRAKYVEGAGVGHVDAGATSVAELLKLFAGGAAA